MSLGIFKRVALWKVQRHHTRQQRYVEELLGTDPSTPELPLAVANFWRGLSPQVLTDIAMDVQISTQLRRRHTTFDHTVELLEKALTLIGNDDYDHLNSYLTRQLSKVTHNTLSEFLTDKKGYPINPEATYIRVTTLLYSLASVLDGMETYEYHRTVNVIHRDLLEIVAQLLPLKQQ